MPPDVVLNCFVLKVSGLTRRANYHGRWEKLIKKATDILNRLLVMAGKVPRNYIIDQVGNPPPIEPQQALCSLSLSLSLSTHTHTHTHTHITD